MERTRAPQSAEEAASIANELRLVRALEGIEHKLGRQCDILDNILREIELQRASGDAR